MPASRGDLGTWKAGEDSASAAARLEFQRWAESHRPVLVRLAYRYLWNVHDAEEIVQDAMTLAWREAGQVSDLKHRDAWLYRATINLAMNRLRRLKAGPLPPEEAIVAPPAAESQAEMDELMQRVRMAMRELPDRQQAAIILRDLEGLAYERIAEVLEVSPAAARLLVHRAREAVRQILLRRWPDSFGP